MSETYRGVSRASYARVVTALAAGKPIPTGEVGGGRVDGGMPRRRIAPRAYASVAHRMPSWVDLFVETVREGITAGVIENAIVHGSHGDGSFTQYSDVDVTLVVGTDTLTVADATRAFSAWLTTRLVPLLLRLDPLQHHGPFLLWPTLVESYNEHILPLAAYRNCWAVKGVDLDVLIADPPPSEEMVAALDGTLHRLQRSGDTFFRRGRTPYALKQLISNLVLVPAFFYQSRGIVMTKQEALSRMIDEGPESTRLAVDAATRLRRDWPRPPAWLGRVRSQIVGGRIPGGRLDTIALAMYRDRQLASRYREELEPHLAGFCAGIRTM